MQYRAGYLRVFSGM